MKIAFFMTFFCAFQALAFNGKAQNAVIELPSNSVTVETFFSEIEKQTDYLIVYSNRELNVKAQIMLLKKKDKVSNMLNEFLKNTDLKYENVNNYIIFSQKNSGVQASQQAKKRIIGTVMDNNGEAIIGASIMEKGTSTGTITDIDGKFSLEVGDNASLTFSYIGYQTQTVKAGNAPINVILVEDFQRLDEVVVVGYGTTTKRSMISSVSTVKASDMTNLPITNVTQGLAGRAPGLIVQASGGGINKTSKLSIRGGDTPLVVIDGVIRDYNDFVNMAPENIEAMSILKDASATAVYGSRASNGILQVTTKQGKSGKPSIDYSFNQSWAQPAIWPKKLNSHDFASYMNEAQINDGASKGQYSEEDLRLFADGSDPLGHPNTDWQKLVLKNFAPTQKHNLTITGGSEVNQYYISLGHLYQNSLYKSNNNNLNRTNLQLGETVNIQSIGLKVGAQLDGYLQKTTHPYTLTASNYEGVFSHIQNKTPMQPGLNKYGLPYMLGDNPISETAKDAGYKNDKTSVINGLLNLEWSVPHVKGLTLRAKGNYRFYQIDKKEWRKESAQYTWDSTEPQYSSKPQLMQEMETGTTWTLQYFASYDRSFKKHSLSVLGGYECTYASAHKMKLSRDSYDFAIDQINPGPNATMKNEGSEWENGRAAWIGQAKYNYDNRYFLEGSIRYDGSDNFPKNKRWGAFYSGSLGWSIADEAFMETLRDRHILDMLKLRVSYGQTGLDNWGEDKSDNPYYLKRYSYLPSYILNGSSYVGNGTYVPGFAEGAIPSAYISWFTTNQFDLGLDFSTLNNRLYGMFDYFYYQTTGFLSAPDPLIAGYTNPLGMNLPKISSNGEHRRAGFEMQLGWKDDIGEFHYNVSFNVTKFDQLWANNPDEALDSKKNPYKRKTQATGYKDVYLQSNGFYTSAEDVYNTPKRLNSTNLTAGDISYFDFNGDGVIDDADKIRVGKDSFPRANYGINLDASYKGFSFAVLFQGSSRFDMMLGSALRLHSAAGSTPFYEFQRDYWTPDNVGAKYPRLVATNSINGNNNAQESDFWLINGAYLRLKDIRIGYDFKHKLLSKVSWISRLNVGISGQNIFTISESTKYGLDPENSNSEGFGYPNERVFAINLNLGF